MASEYDSVKIRTLAREIGQVAEKVAEVDGNTIRAIRQELPGNFTGSAADALTQSVEELSQDVRSISSGLREVQNALLALAQRLEAADAAAKALINSR